MISPAYIRLMADYNAEMNRRLYGAAAATHRRGAQGGSRRVLEVDPRHARAHPLGRYPVDVALRRLAEADVAIKQSAGMIDDFAAARCAVKADADIRAWAERVDDAWLAEDLVWFSGAAQKEMRRQEGTAGGAFLQPPDHHRGQAHALLTACGQDTGDTDLFLVVPEAA